MRKRLSLVIVSAIAALLLAAPAALASSEAGWGCTANDSEANWTVLASGSSGFPIPPVIPPEGPKVITSWSLNAEPGLGPIAQRLEVFEVQNEAGEYKKIGESAMETVVAGSNSFLTRIPVTEGDSVGLHGPVETLFCDKEEGAVSLLYDGAVATGETKPFQVATEVGTPVRVVVEDDRDGDGHGDETQDACPQSPTIQGACPVVALSTSKRVRQGSVTVFVTSSAAAPVSVKGVVKLGKARKGKGKVRKAALNGGTQTLAPGVPGKFTLRFTKKVKKKLKALPRKRSLRLDVTVSGTNVAGAVTTTTLKMKLKGQAKPRS